MDILRIAVSGTPESSDVQVTVEPGEGEVELFITSSVLNQYGRQIRATAMEALERLGVSDCKITLVDKGALDCTIRARVESAVFRASEFNGNVPWGEVIRE